MTVTVYRFSVYDISTDEHRRSRRWATREAIERIRSGVVIEDTASEVDLRVLDDNGMTERDFDPEPRSVGFQRSIK